MSRYRRFMQSLISSEAIFVSTRVNMRYMTDYRGEGSLLVTPDACFLLVDGRYVSQAQQETAGVQIVEFEVSALEQTVALCLEQGVRTLFFEQDSLTAHVHSKLAQSWPHDLKPLDARIEQARAVKDEGEQQLIAQSARMTDRVFSEVLPLIRPGVQEKDIAAEIVYRFMRYGDGPSFSPIVASGPNGAQAHAIAGSRRFQAGDMITIDLGGVYQGYCSDMTRTVALGMPGDELQNAYRVVLEAQRRALDNIRAGITGVEADALAREVIDAAGYGACFGHGTGHGVGLEIHEAPRASRTYGQILVENMTLTVEPGIYLPGTGGVRIEDMGFIGAAGFDNLTESAKELLVL